MSYSDPIRKICQKFCFIGKFVPYMKAENYSVRYEQLKNTLSVGSDVLTKYFMTATYNFEVRKSLGYCWEWKKSLRLERVLLYG